MLGDLAGMPRARLRRLAGGVAVCVRPLRPVFALCCACMRPFKIRQAANHTSSPLSYRRGSSPEFGQFAAIEDRKWQNHCGKGKNVGFSVRYRDFLASRCCRPCVRAECLWRKDDSHAW
jgi:hypothetical protein